LAPNDELCQKGFEYEQHEITGRLQHTDTWKAKNTRGNHFFKNLRECDGERGTIVFTICGECDFIMTLSKKKWPFWDGSDEIWSKNVDKVSKNSTCTFPVFRIWQQIKNNAPSTYSTMQYHLNSDDV
jgi:hypothetical protein